jgi:hypothetical protein
MRKAVNDSIRESGTAIIRNKMASRQQIQVNQKDYTVDAGGSLTLDVPVGTLTAKLPGQKLTTWTVTAPKYEQIIDIVANSETVTAYRPMDSSSTVTTLRPLGTTTTVYSAPVYTAPVYTAPVYTAPVYTAPVYVETSPTYYYDPWTGIWYRY